MRLLPDRHSVRAPISYIGAGVLAGGVLGVVLTLWFESLLAGVVGLVLAVVVAAGLKYGPKPR